MTFDAHTSAWSRNQLAPRSLNPKVFVIDEDVKRRAKLAFELNNLSYFCQPCEGPGEMIAMRPNNAMVLANDDGESVAKIIESAACEHIRVNVIAYAESPRPQQVVEAVLAGALGYLAWPASPEAVQAVLGKVLGRLADYVPDGQRKERATALIAMLSFREKEVLAGMLEGLSNRQIGPILSISPRTVELHRANLLEKLGMRSGEAIRLAVEAGLTVSRKFSPGED